MDASQNRLLVSGMVRSGTTLISRCIDAHPQIACPPDPYMGFFLQFRNDLYAGAYGDDFDPEMPLSDFFFVDKPDIQIYLEADFNREYTHPFDVIQNKMRPFTQNNSPKLLPYLERLTGRTYAEILDGLLDRIQEAFGDEQTEWIGFKQTWSEAFIASFLNTWPDAKCIHIIRDPRAVLASWKRSSVLSHDYPALMILRHWRKSAALASLYSRRYENHRIVRFEDFTQAPEEQMRKICEFCGLPFDEKTIDAAHFRSGSGSQWTSNTSYQVEEQGISKQYISAWKDRLSDEELQFVEDLCGLEMERMGYARETGGSDPGSILHPPCITRQVQAQVEWVNKFAAEYDLNSANQAKELCRWLLHRHRLEYNSTLSREDLRRIFIDPDLLS